MCYTKNRQNITKESYRQQNPMKFVPSWGFLCYIAVEKLDKLLADIEELKI